MRARWREFKALPPDEQARIRHHFERFRQLTPQQRSQLRDRWKQLTPEQRRAFHERTGARRGRD
jgi:hypothetical protein